MTAMIIGRSIKRLTASLLNTLYAIYAKAATSTSDTTASIIWNNPAYNKYIYYVLNSDKLIKYVSLLGGYNTQINVGMRNLEKAYIPFPGKLYQKIIADYLDNIIPVIDNIIHSIKISIEDYKKYKQSILADIWNLYSIMQRCRRLKISMKRIIQIV